MDLADFDLYVNEREANGDRTPVAIMFAEWLASLSGEAVIGSPHGEGPEFVAVPNAE